MQDRPDHDELLGAIEGFLRTEILPNSDGARRFQARVAVNTLQIVRRELARTDEQLTAERGRLRNLLGVPATADTAGSHHLRAQVRELTAALCERIRAGEADEGTFGLAVREHVRATVREKLEVTNPGWLEPVS